MSLSNLSTDILKVVEEFIKKFTKIKVSGKQEGWEFDKKIITGVAGL